MTWRPGGLVSWCAGSLAPLSLSIFGLDDAESRHCRHFWFGMALKCGCFFELVFDALPTEPAMFRGCISVPFLRLFFLESPAQNRTIALGFAEKNDQTMN